MLKGGFLIGSKYGIENRTTKDIDTTLLREMESNQRNINNGSKRNFLLILQKMEFVLN
ncbi:nucleotidyl transferase AbiEii/AbiGii toxin family protein [Enterococcus faecium]|nr:nucleotidyl transferase AbiEii/AbiGii toxin family protein [Enterococcus faecium]UWS53759.1 nucleotidyl transferase AbiEii/AbiGii toxin family protein [Enterococcus faecium]